MSTKKYNEFISETPEVETFQTQALEIKEPDENFDPTTKPETGDEFLTHMLYERKRCPAIVVCKPKETKEQVYEKLASIIEEKKIDQSHQSETFLSTIHWRVAQLAEFQKARDEVNNVRETLESFNYNQCLELPLTNEANDWQKFCQEHQPFLSIILRFDQNKLVQLLEMIELWFACGIETEKPQPTTQNDGESEDEEKEAEAEEEETEDEVKVKDTLKATTAVKTTATETTTTKATAEKTKLLSTTPPETATATTTPSTIETITSSSGLIDLLGNYNWLGQWLYASLACLHLPLQPNVHSTLRSIARHCIQQRSLWAQQCIEKGLPFNVFIYLIAKVFNQLDFENFV